MSTNNVNPRSMMTKSSSIATRAQMANQSVDSSHLWGLCALICTALALVYPLVYCTIEYGLFGGDTDYSAYRNQPESDKTYELGISDTAPTTNLTDRQFLLYLGFVMWATMVLTGLGLEVLVWLSFLQGKWTQEMEMYWRVAQFVFPLLIATAVGLAMTHNFLAMPIVVFGMYKFGFPETILYLYAGLYDKRHSPLQRAVDLINGIGTVIHHSTSAMYVAMVVTGALPADRHVLIVTFPLLMQHWFVLLKYYNTWSYAIPQLLLEGWFEWGILSSLEDIHSIHWIGGVQMGAMLVAHWLYLIGGGLSMVLPDEHGHGDPHHANYAMNRLQRAYAPGTSGHEMHFAGGNSSDGERQVGFDIPDDDDDLSLGKGLENTINSKTSDDANDVDV